MNAGCHLAFKVRRELFTGENFNLNDILWHADGYLLVNKHNSGELLRISMTGTPDIQRVVLPEALKGADGLLRLTPNRVALAQDSGADRLVGLVPDFGWQSSTIASERKTAGTFPTTAVRVGKNHYVLNSRPDTRTTPDEPRVSDYLLNQLCAR